MGLLRPRTGKMREKNTKEKCLDGKCRISATGAKQDVKLAQFTYFRIGLSLAAAIQGLYFIFVLSMCSENTCML